VKLFFLLEFLIFLFYCCQITVGQTFKDTPDSTFGSSDTTPEISNPKFYTNSNLLVGAEIIDPFNPTEFFSRATQLWKTDIRIGMSFAFTKDIVSFIAIRDNDSPGTNDINLYEAGVKINHDWGMLLFGQKRIQAGNLSYYLNDAFDRSFWDRGLIYDFIIRGMVTKINFSCSEIEIFLGSEVSASFIGGTGYGIEIIPGWKAKASALYIARDPEYSAFGWQLGVESEESYKHFYGYQVIAYKIFDQEPKPFQELTLFAEGRLKPDNHWELGLAGLFKRLLDIGFNRDELRGSFDVKYKISENVSPALQTEVFELTNFTEIHVGASVYFQYFTSLRIAPRVRYIFTEFGPDIAFFGLETKIVFGEWE
jgi:hypothetical protein